MSHSWDYEVASTRINKLIEDVTDVSIVDYTRDMSLENIPSNKAYRSNSVHLYIDILNLNDMLHSTHSEGVTSHQRTLRFLNLHYRAVHRILNDCDVLRVDFHNQRLHAVLFKPYDSQIDAEKIRVQKAVAISKLVMDVLNETGDTDQYIDNAKVRIGIDSGKTLIVNNGRNGGREPLFLGEPANEAAKLASGGESAGIYITNNSRLILELNEVDNPKLNRLSKAEIMASEEAADIDSNKDKIVEEWREDLFNNPIGSFNFTSHTPPLKNLDITVLTPGNSKRQELTSIYADIDGFTAYVRDNIDNDESAKDVVRTLHVIRSELDKVLSQDFEGRKIRFVGDCLHGIHCVGTAQNTDVEKTITESVLCCGAMRSSFDLALEKLSENTIVSNGIGLAIGFDFGITSTTRLGMKGDRVRVSVSRAVLESESQQLKCEGSETAIGLNAYNSATQAVQTLFGAAKKKDNLDYSEAVTFLADNGDEVADMAKSKVYADFSAEALSSIEAPSKPYSE